MLCKIFENRVQDNPQKLNSASKLSRCVQKEQSKVISALPTNNSILEIFEKTVTGGFSRVNTHLSFDSEILMSNLKKSDFDRMNINQSFTAFKNDDIKVVYKMKLDGEKTYEKIGVISKI